MSITTTTMSEAAERNIEEIELDITTSSAYFKPREGITYVIEVDLDKHKIRVVESERFKDVKGNPVKRYEFKIVHVDNGREQLWETSKTTCSQIIDQVKKGLTILKVVRTGIDRTTTYSIEGVQ